MIEIFQQRIESVQLGKNITHAQIIAKQNLREQLEIDMAKFLAGGSQVEVLPEGFSHFKDGIIPQSKARSVQSEQEKTEREEAIKATNQEIRERKAAAKAIVKQKHDEQIKEQIALLGGFKSKSTYDDFKRLAEMAGYKTRHFCDAAKGHSKLSDERWVSVKKLISKFNATSVNK